MCGGVSVRHGESVALPFQRLNTASRQPVLLRRLREADADVIALQECWGTSLTTQAHEFAAALGMHAGFAAPGLPPAPYPPESPDQADVEVGIGLVSRWPLTSIRAVDLPARHRTPAPVAAVTRSRTRLDRCT